MGHHDDLLSPEAMEDYFQEVYWRKGEGLGDDFLEKFRMNKHGTSFSFREVGESFRLIQSGLESVIVAREEEVHKALRDLAYAERPRRHSAAAPALRCASLPSLPQGACQQ